MWGLSSPLAGTPTPARQGNAARARTNPGQPSKFRKGLGKGTHKSPQAKRSREQEAEEEFWMDQDQLDEETIKRILRLLVRAASRHEQQLTSLEADRSYVFFLEVGHHGLIGMLVQASQAWHQQFEAGTVTTSLRATLWGVLLLEWKTRRKRRQCSSDSRDGPLDHADSAPVDLYRMECGAKESLASQPGQPTTRGSQKSGESTSQVHSQGRRRASIPESETTQAGHTSRGSGDAPDTHHPPTGSGDLQRPGHSGEQLCREADRPTPKTRTSQQECAGQRVGKTTALSDERTPTRSKPSTANPEGDTRSPLPKLVRPLSDVTQPDIFTFFLRERPVPLTIMLQPLLLPLNPKRPRRPALLGTQLTATG